MIFIDNEGNYPRFIGDLQLQYPNWQVGDEVPSDWTEVIETDAPELGLYQFLSYGKPELVDGKMVQTWVVRDPTPEELYELEAPKRAKEKLLALGLTESEIQALVRGII